MMWMGIFRAPLTASSRFLCCPPKTNLLSLNIPYTQERCASSNGSSTPSRSSRQIWGGKKILSGNMRSFSERKTRRRWLPNVQTKRMYSELLNQQLTLRITAYVLRIIDKYGGIDNFILFAKPKYLEDSALAQDLKVRMIQAWESKNNAKYDRTEILFERRKVEESKQNAL